MVGIRGVAGSVAAGPARPGRAAAPAFRLAAGQGSAVAGAAALGAVAPGLLALQEEGSVRERDARARRRATAVLDELAALQAELLAGAADPARLDRLARLAEGEEAADPALAAIVAEVSLRARVEIARRATTVTTASR